MSDYRQTNPNNCKNPSRIKITPKILVILTTLRTQITLKTNTTQITLVPPITIKSQPKPVTTLI
jgi:hypothetical protein